MTRGGGGPALPEAEGPVRRYRALSWATIPIGAHVAGTVASGLGVAGVLTVFRETSSTYSMCSAW